MPVLDFHDANANDAVVGKMKSPTHCARVVVDYEYQAEQHVIDAATDYPFVVRCVLDDGRREWHRQGGSFVEVTHRIGEEKGNG